MDNELQRLSDDETTDHSAHHVTPDVLDAAFAHACDAPRDGGTVELLLYRPASNERVVVSEIELDVERGVVGDNWNERSSSRTEDGSAHPDMQLNIMNARVAAAVAGDRDRWALAGDQLYVDFDLSAAELAEWTKLRIGDAVIQITDQPHTGCAKFRRRFGADALRWINSDAGKEQKFRGVNAKVIESGTVRIGDSITRL